MDTKIKSDDCFFSMKRTNCTFICTYDGRCEASIKDEGDGRIDFEAKAYTQQLLDFLRNNNEFTKDTYLFANKYDNNLIEFLIELGFEIVEPLSNTYSQYMRWSNESS